MQVLRRLPQPLIPPLPAHLHDLWVTLVLGDVLQQQQQATKSGKLIRKLNSTTTLHSCATQVNLLPLPTC